MSDQLTDELVAPQRGGHDICPLCHSWRAPEMKVCNSCEITGRAVDFPIGPPSVISLVTKPSPLRDWLTRYKGRPGDDKDPFERSSFDHVCAILGRYLIEHGRDVVEAAGPLDAVVAVPSGAAKRPPPHPLETVLDTLHLPLPVDTLLVRGPGELGFRHAAVDGYVSACRSSPMRIFLIDDVFVTGARVFSAARALIDNGHTVAGTLVLARRVNRDWGDCQDMWDRQSALGFDWSTGPYTARPEPPLLEQLRRA